MSAMGRAIQSLYLVLSVMGWCWWHALRRKPIQCLLGRKSLRTDRHAINQLKKGEFLWMGEAVTKGLVMVVSIKESEVRLSQRI